MNLQDQISIILVKPEKPRNIGQVARAMKNFGFVNLRLVSPPAGNMREAYENAVDAKDIIDSRVVVNNILDAAKDLNILIGTTSRETERPLSPWELVDFIMKNPTLKYGILFGTEFRGLSNEELAHCHKVVSIPTSEIYPSMNLSHAVAIICYEIKKGIIANSHEIYINKEPLATIAEIEHLLEHARTTLKNIGFIYDSSPDRIIPILRRLSVNLELTSRDIRILRGILRRIDWIYSLTIDKKSAL